MKIVVLDGYAANPGDLSWDELAALGSLTVYDRTAAKEITARIADAEIVFTNKTPLTAETLAQCSKLRFIGVLATGYNIVDVQKAKEQGVVVCNVPAYSTMSVAQMTFALLLELCSHVGEHSEAAKGRWVDSPDFSFQVAPLTEISGKTLGIIGFGRIGQAVGKIAAAFGMKVLASGSRPTEQGSAIAQYVTLDELWAQSDIISLHCPLLPQTEQIINKNTIAKMKDGVMILNTGRGALVDEQALADALHSGKVAGAGLDVLKNEPPKKDCPLLTAPNCYITPHIAWAPKESRQRLMNVTVENLRQFLAGTPVNVVDP